MRDLEEVRRLMARHRGESGEASDRPKRSLPDRAPASAAQKSVWLASALDPDDVSYNLCLMFTFEGPVDARALAGAFEDLVERHEVLRTTYHVDDEGELQQRIHPDLGPEITWHAMPPGESGDAAVDALTAEQVRRPFDLAVQSPLRLAICERGTGRVDAVMVIQHIAWDGMTMPVLARDVSRAYRLRIGESLDGDGSVQRPAIQVADFAEWEASHPDASGERHWRSVFPDGVPQIRPTLGGVPDAAPNSGGRVDAVLPDAAARALSGIAEELSVTPFAVFLAAHHLVLRALTGARDTVTGTTVANREAVGADELIGNFSNQVPIRISDEGAATFGDLVERAAGAVAGAMSAKAVPFDRISAIAGVDRAAGETLFPVLVLFLHEGIAGPQLPGAQTSWELVHPGAAIHAVATEVFVHPGRVEVQMTHRLDTVSSEGAEALQRALAAVLSDARADAPTEELAAAAELTSVRALASDMGRGRSVPVDPEDVDAMIRRASGASPDSVAVVAEDRTLTYAEFEARTEALASRIAEAGAGAGEIVAVVAERCSWLPCAIAAVIRTGAAVVPVDPGYPAERIRMMLDDASPVVVVRAGSVSLPETEATVVDVERLGDDGRESGVPAVHPERPIRGDDPVYLIYTSGTTGRPKGVINRHRGVASHLQWMARTFGDGPIRMLHKAPVSFDVGMGEVLLALTSGGTAVIPPADWWAGDADGLSAMVEEHRITVLSLVPGLLRELLVAGAAGRLTTLRHLLLGGEAVPTDLARRARAEIGCRVHGLYGPSETAMDVAWVEYGDDVPEDGFLLGVAEDNNDLHVLDRELREVPAGEAGELCIGGVQVGLGYHGAPEATAAAFVADPFRPGGTLYRTGDVAKWGADGLLRFLGRIGDQVKIRGNRVELLDIDAALCRVDGVAAGACRFFGGSGQPSRLVGYVVTADGAEPDARGILADLSRALPAYMIPGTILGVGSLPTTSTGKLDRAALPEPPAAHDGAEDFEEPRGAAELAVADAFARAIGKHVHPTAESGLVELGGDSITAIRAISLLRRSGWEAEVRDILGGGTVRTVAAAARRVSAVDANSGEGRVHGSEEGFAESAPVHPLAATLLETVPGGGGLCQARLLSAPADFGTVQLSEVLEKLIDRHPVLSRAVVDDAGWPMFIAPSGGVEPFVTDAGTMAGADAPGELIGALSGHLDPARGAMIAGAVVESPAGRRILLVAHHLVVDAVSWETLIDDIREIRGAAKGVPAGFRREEAAADHARRLRAATLSGDFDRDMAAWGRIAEAASGTLAVDPARDTEATVDIAEVAMPEASSEALSEDVTRAFGCTGQDIVIAGLSMALHRLGLASGGRIGLTLESHGRDSAGSVPPVPPDAVGWFTASYPIAVELGPRPDPVGAVHAVRRARRDLPANVHAHGCAMWRERRTESRPVACLNHLGILASDVRERDFAPAPEAPALIGAADASAPLPNVIDVMSHIGEDGLLAATIRVAAEVPGAPSADDVGRELGVALAEISAVAADDVRPAPADFTASGITDADIRSWGGEIEDVLPLTPMQEGLMLSSLSSGDPAGYAVQTPLRVRGRVDVAALGRAVGAVLRRFPNMRVQPAVTAAGVPVGVVRPCGTFTCRSADNSDEADLIAADAAEGFDFSAAPLLRVTVAHPGEDVDDETLVLISAHHILTDGWTGQLLPLAIFSEYAREIGVDPGAGPIGDPEAFPALLEMIAEDGPECRRAWEDRLRGVSPALLGPETTPTRAGQSSRMSSIGQDVVDRLHAVTRRCGVTPAVAYQLAWARTLAIALGRDDVVFGEVVSGRDPAIAGVAEGIGCFANLVAVPVSVDAAGTWSNALARLRDERLPLLGHDHFPMTRALTVTGARRLFDTMFVYQSYPPHQDRLTSILESCGLEHAGIDPGGTTDNAALLMVFPGDSVLGGAGSRFLLTVADGVIDDAAAEVIEGLFLACVRTIADAPDTAMAEGPVPDEFDDIVLGGILR